MPSPRHENSVESIKKLVKEQKIGQVIENTDMGGKGGYELPGILCSDNKTRPFIIDCAVRTNKGAMLAFEVDLNHETTAHKIEQLHKFGWTFIKATPTMVDTWKEDPDLLKDEIAYWLAQSAKRFEAMRIIH